MPEFTPFPKMARLSRECIITEKIDGTNAQIHIADDGTILTGSRTRWVIPDDDHFGFAAWVKENEDDLRNLGPGYALRRMVGTRHPAQLRPQRTALQSLQRQPMGH